MKQPLFPSSIGAQSRSAKFLTIKIVVRKTMVTPGPGSWTRRASDGGGVHYYRHNRTIGFLDSADPILGSAIVIHHPSSILGPKPTFTPNQRQNTSTLHCHGHNRLSGLCCDSASIQTRPDQTRSDQTLPPQAALLPSRVLRLRLLLLPLLLLLLVLLLLLPPQGLNRGQRPFAPGYLAAVAWQRIQLDGTAGNLLIANGIPKGDLEGSTLGLSDRETKILIPLGGSGARAHVALLRALADAQPHDGTGFGQAGGCWQPCW